jgi:1,4-dihydroxy-2-naphthoyl-CoA synthase
MYSDYKQLRFKRRENGILLITINRPEKYNAADEGMHSELTRVWKDVSADPETRVAVLHGPRRRRGSRCTAREAPTRFPSAAQSIPKAKSAEESSQGGE